MLYYLFILTGQAQYTKHIDMGPRRFLNFNCYKKNSKVDVLINNLRYTKKTIIVIKEKTTKNIINKYYN